MAVPPEDRPDAAADPLAVDWPPPNSEAFVRMLCLFAEHLSADELRGGLLMQIRVHGRSLQEHFEKLILGERIAEAQTRATVVAALGWSGQPSSTTAVRAALDDPAPPVLRAAAYAAWHHLRQPRLAPRLYELLVQPDGEPDVAVAAADSLSHFAVQRALPAMVQLALNQPAGLTDDEREQLLRAIQRLGRVNLGDPTQLTLRQRLARLRLWWHDRPPPEEEPSR